MQIVDNILPTDEFQALQNLLLGPSMPWYYLSNISAPDWLKVEDPLAVETEACQCLILDNTRHYKSEEYRILRPYLLELAHRIGKREEDYMRIRAVMKWPKLGITDEYYNLPHIDSIDSTLTGILYINDSDGDTRLFHQKQKLFSSKITDNSTDEEVKEYASNFIRSGFTTEHRITPKANRLLLFDGLQYHTAGMPVNTERRVIININFV